MQMLEKAPSALESRENGLDRVELPDDSGDSMGQMELPDDSGERMPEPPKEAEPKTDVEKQKIADEAAKEYNAKYRPFDRARQKGIDGVTETANGGVSFEDSEAIFVGEDGKKGSVSIEATGNRSKDFEAANKQLGLPETPKGYVWHHMDDYDVKTNTITMQLVKDDAHNVTKPHAGGCAQYDAVNGSSYNPPRKDV